MTFPKSIAARRDEYVTLVIEEMLPRVAEQKLAEYCDVFCEENVFTTDEVAENTARQRVAKVLGCESTLINCRFQAAQNWPRS